MQKENPIDGRQCTRLAGWLLHVVDLNGSAHRHSPEQKSPLQGPVIGPSVPRSGPRSQLFPTASAQTQLPLAASTAQPSGCDWPPLLVCACCASRSQVARHIASRAHDFELLASHPGRIRTY